MRLRLLDLGDVPYLESQTIYHAIACAMTAGSPNTVSLMSPVEPYISVGFHQEVAKEIDLDFCRVEGLPIVRREVGGGAVYLDNNQVFVHLVAHREDLPRNLEEVYRLFIGPIVATYRDFGVNAEHRPLNDIIVGPRKIGGTGIASIGEAMVVVGSLMFDFDSQAMASALKVSSEKMRDKVIQGLQDYMTTLTRELGQAPPREEVKAALVRNMARSFGAELEPGKLTVAELRQVHALNRRFASAKWTNLKAGLETSGIKIRGGVTIAEAEHKAPGGLIRVTARLNEGVIEDVSISGDFTFQPAAMVGELETALRAEPLDGDRLAAAIAAFYQAHGIQSPGVEPADIAQALLLLQPPTG